MTPKLTEDQRRALLERPDGPVPVEDEHTHREYVIVDKRVHQQAMQALREQEDLAAIQGGIEDLEDGRIIPFEEIDAKIRKRLGMPPRVGRTASY